MDVNSGRSLAGPIITMGAAVAVISSLAGPASALVINPAFTASITGATNTAAVEGAISAAIGTIDSLYANPGTVGIVFEQTSGSFLGASEAGEYVIPYSSYTNLLRAESTANPRNTVLSTAIAHLGQANDASGSNSIVATTALLRVGLGDASATGCFNSSGAYVNGCGQLYDGVVLLSSSYSFFFSPSGYSSSSYNARSTLEHEIDEILGGGGQGSVLNAQYLAQQGTTAYNSYLSLYGPLDLYRYSAPGTPSFTTATSPSPYFSVDGGTTDIIGFNNNPSGDFADFGPTGYVQSAFNGTGQNPAYTTATPEFTMMEAIGYDGITTPEPGALALLAPAIGALTLVRRRSVRVAEPAPTSPPG